MTHKKMTCLTLIVSALLMPSFHASLSAEKTLPLISPSKALPDVFTQAEILKLLKSVDAGLVALEKLQESDGSFAAEIHHKTGITGLAAMAYLSRGHKPGQGRYGQTINKAVEYVLDSQHHDGLFAGQSTNGNTNSYNHAIALLLLGEVYGMLPEKELPRMHKAIEKGLKFTLKLWDMPAKEGYYDGGFRYLNPRKRYPQSDVSVTAWHATSLRSIRNAGFDVPKNVIDRIAAYVIRTQNEQGAFPYSQHYPSAYTTTGAGVLCLMLGGKYKHPSTLKAAAFLATYEGAKLSSYSAKGKYWPYYTSYYVSQSAIQLGGRVWTKCMREVYTFLIKRQNQDGTWPADHTSYRFGEAYSTAMAINALTPVLQLLPIYQR